MEKITSLLAHKVICISQSVRELGVQNRIFKEENTALIHKGSSNGFDLTKFKPGSISTDSKIELRKVLKLNKSNFVYGFLGRIIDRKGINELYEAFCDQYSINNNIRLLIVGPFDKSQIKNERLFDLLTNHPGIIMPGRTDEVPSYLSIMDIFVLPAWWEGFGNVLVQAAAMGIPVISTFGTGTRDAVSDGYNGILIPVKDVSKLKEAMVELLVNNSKRNELGNNGIEWSKNFENKIIWKGMLDIYKE